MQEHTFYSPKEAANFLGLSTISLSMWRTHGEGPPFFKSPTGRVVYHIRDLKALKAKRAQAKHSPRHIRPNGEPDKRKGHTSYATRLARGEKWEDLPGVAGKKNSEGGEEFTSEDLHKYINESIKAGNLTVMQAKQMQQEMKVARVRDLDTSAKVRNAKTMIDSFIKKNEA